MEFPEGFVSLVWDRGGMAAKFGLHLLAGVIDSNFRGEVTAIMLNTSDEKYRIHKGDKIGQMIIQRYEQVELKQTDELSETERGEQAWLSSGK